MLRLLNFHCIMIINNIFIENFMLFPLQLLEQFQTERTSVIRRLMADSNSFASQIIKACNAAAIPVTEEGVCLGFSKITSLSFLNSASWGHFLLQLCAPERPEPLIRAISFLNSPRYFLEGGTGQIDIFRHHFQDLEDWYFSSTADTLECFKSLSPEADEAYTFAHSYMKLKGLSEASLLACYNRSEMVIFLKELMAQASDRFSLLLCANSHAISVMFDPETGKWIIANSNDECMEGKFLSVITSVRFNLKQTQLVI